jgi:hypothetical protein
MNGTIRRMSGKWWRAWRAALLRAFSAWAA